MKLKYFSVLIIGIVFCLRCSKDDKNELSKSIEISGITERDNAGHKTGTIDPTDWNFNETWSDMEEGLFKKNNAAHNKPTELSLPVSASVTGYPNPAKGMMSFAFRISDKMYFDYRVVDNFLNVKISGDSVKYSSWGFEQTRFTIDQLYRIYYKIYDGTKVYRGHGDFKFVK